MENVKNKSALSQEDIMKILDACYRKAMSGIGQISPPIEQFAADYQSKNEAAADAARKMIRVQVAKCTTSGVVNGYGGIIALPVAVPANIGSVLYVQMRMIACTAYLAGYDVRSDQVQTLVYACLAGVTVNGILKRAGTEFGKKFAMAAVKKIPGEVLVKINQKVGFRLLTKFGEKGLINIGKLVPGVGALISGGLDFAETKAIGARAYRMFFEGNFVEEETTDEVNFIDVEVCEAVSECSCTVEKHKAKQG